MILFVLPNLSGGGAERVILNLLIGLHNNGYLVGIIVFERRGALLSMIPHNIPIYNLGSIKLRHSILGLIKNIRQLNPKLIFSTLGYINVALLSIRWALPQNVKILVREANLPSISLPNNSHQRLMTIFYRILYRKADKLICTSARMRDEFVLDFSIPESIIEILPNPVDEKSIRELSVPVKRFDNGGVCYIASGRMLYQKGFDRLIKWFSTLNDKTSTLVFLGEGNDSEKLIQQSKDLSLQNQIKFVGFCKNPWQWYAGADMFLLPSRWEGMPNVVLESLACGTPVIATTESGGVAEIARQVVGNNLIVVRPSSFLNKMLEVESNPEKTLGPSLLPKMYRIESSISIFKGFIAEYIRE